MKRMENLPNYAAAIRNPPNEQVAYEATLEVRKLLSIEKNPPIEVCTLVLTVREFFP